MDDKMIQWLAMKSESGLYVYKAYLFHNEHFLYVVEAFMTINWKD